MALIKEMPGLKIISGFRGVVDFYYWKGKAVARSWPRSPGKSRSEGVKRGWVPLRESTRLWNQLDQSVRDVYNNMATSTPLTGRDIFTRSYISGLKRIYRR